MHVVAAGSGLVTYACRAAVAVILFLGSSGPSGLFLGPSGLSVGSSEPPLVSFLGGFVGSHLALSTCCRGLAFFAVSYYWLPF